MKLEDFHPRYRVHTIANWPRAFDSLAGAIAFIRGRDPLWYMLEELTDDGDRVVIVSPERSRQRNNFFYTEGPDYDELR